MSAGSTSHYMARVQAKDETAKVELSITSETTVGELLKYWNWRSSADSLSEGFLIDISPVKDSNVRAKRDFAAVEGIVQAAKKVKHVKQSRPPPGHLLKTLQSSFGASSSAKRAPKEVVDMSMEEEEEEEEVEEKAAVSAPVEHLKLDPKAGCKIDVKFSDGRKIPMHILENTPIEKIAKSACKVLKIPLQGMTFTYEKNRYEPYALSSPAQYSSRGVLKRESVWLWDMLARKWTAKDWGLKAGSVITATIYGTAQSPRQAEGTIVPIVEHGREGWHTRGIFVSLIEAAKKSNGERRPTSKFNIRVRTLTGKVFHLTILPSTRAEDIGRAVCETDGIPFEQARFIREGVRFCPSYIQALEYDAVPEDKRAVMLIRDREACDRTAEEWGLEEGSDLYMVLCLCGC